MKTEELYFPSATEVADIYTKLWIPDKKPKAILQIAHGMAEHIERYDDFARFMVQKGVLVAGNDHAGHKRSIKSTEDLGYFGKNNGWSHVVEDMHTLHNIITERYKDLPYIMMGHSMGSLLTRSYASSYGKTEDIAAYILSGTAGRNPVAGPGAILAKIERLKNGSKKPSALLHSLTFGNYNQCFKPNRTDVDWLSSDNEQVDKYVNDDYCGFMFTAEAMADIMYGLKEIEGTQWAEHVKNVPILVFSGEKDPVGGVDVKGVKQVIGWLKDTGHDVTCKFYADGRHEMLNETNKAEVYDDIYAFISKVIKSA